MVKVYRDKLSITRGTKKTGKLYQDGFVPVNFLPVVTVSGFVKKN